MVRSQDIRVGKVVVAGFALLWAVGQFGQIFGMGFKLFFLDIALLLLVGVYLMQGKDFGGAGVKKALWVMWAAMALSFVVSFWGKEQSEILVAAMYLVRMGVVLGLFWSVIQIKKSSLESGISLGLWTFLLIALGMYFLFPDMRQIKVLGYDDHYYRAIGSLLDPNLSAMVYIWAFYWFTHRGVKIGQLLAVLLLALSFSRSGYLAFGASILLVMLGYRDWRVAAWLPVLAVLIVLAPKPFGEGVNLARRYSIESRALNIKSSLAQTRGNVWFGQGFNFVSGGGERRYTNRSSGVDNSFLFLWMTCGVVGMAAFGYVVLQTARLVSGGMWATGGFAALLIHSAFNNTLIQLQVLVLSMVMLGYLWRVAHDK